ncbi:MAG: hypothetical protein JOZ51_04370 [Chloroflexi bacterium]|nr:hypothetical protein [Chloroflexota bacterium]
MPGSVLTTQSQMQCPHGGRVQATSSNTKVSAGTGAYVLRMNDTFTIVGCPYQMPAPSGTVPSPCMRVQWLIADRRTQAGQQPTLSETSVGLCFSAQQVPQGNVKVVSTQGKAKSQ